jgi:hypothetical protein
MWDAFRFWGWQYGVEYSRLLRWPEIVFNGLLYTAVAGAYWAALLLCVVSGRSQPRLAVFWIATALASVSVGGRFSLHYYLVALPPLCILAAPGALALIGDGARAARVAAALAATALVVTFITSWSWFHIKPQNFQSRYEEVGGYIRAHTAPADRVFVWGNSPEIYLYAQRVMGTRFAFCNYHTGMIWGTWANDQDGAIGTEVLAVPRAWQELLADLTQAPPTLLVDGGAGGLDRFDQHPMTAYPTLKEVMERGYRLEATIRGVPIYRRIR